MARRPALDRLTRGSFRAELDGFVQTLRLWAGEYLWLDAEEVFAGMDDEERERATRFDVLSLLDGAGCLSEGITAAALWYTGVGSAAEFDRQPEKVIGHLAG